MDSNLSDQMTHLNISAAASDDVPPITEGDPDLEGEFLIDENGRMTYRVSERLQRRAGLPRLLTGEASDCCWDADVQVEMAILSLTAQALIDHYPPPFLDPATAGLDPSADEWASRAAAHEKMTRAVKDLSKILVASYLGPESFKSRSPWVRRTFDALNEVISDLPVDDRWAHFVHDGLEHVEASVFCGDSHASDIAPLSAYYLEKAAKEITRLEEEAATLREQNSRLTASAQQLVEEKMGLASELQRYWMVNYNLSEELRIRDQMIFQLSSRLGDTSVTGYSTS